MAELQRHNLADLAVMQKVIHFITSAWPAKPKTVKGVKGLRVVVAQNLHEEYLYIQLLHKGHPGIDAPYRFCCSIIPAFQ